MMPNDTSKSHIDRFLDTQTCVLVENQIRVPKQY